MTINKARKLTATVSASLVIQVLCVSLFDQLTSYIRLGEEREKIDKVGK